MAGFKRVFTARQAARTQQYDAKIDLPRVSAWGGLYVGSVCIIEML